MGAALGRRPVADCICLTPILPGPKSPSPSRLMPPAWTSNSSSLSAMMRSSFGCRMLSRTALALLRPHAVLMVASGASVCDGAGGRVAQALPTSWAPGRGWPGHGGGVMPCVLSPCWVLGGVADGLTPNLRALRLRLRRMLACSDGSSANRRFNEVYSPLLSSHLSSWPLPRALAAFAQLDFELDAALAVQQRPVSNW